MPQSMTSQTASHEHDKFGVLKWPPQSPDLSAIEYLCRVEEQEIHSMNVELTILQQLSDAIVSTWAPNLKGIFSAPCGIHAMKMAGLRAEHILASITTYSLHTYITPSRSVFMNVTAKMFLFASSQFARFFFSPTRKLHELMGLQVHASSFKLPPVKTHM